MEMNQQLKFVVTYAVAAQGGRNLEKQRSQSVTNAPPVPMPMENKEIITEEIGLEDDPKYWLKMAKSELDLKNLCQASEKAYMAGRKALDSYVKRNGIKLDSHDAANYFMRCLCKEMHSLPQEPYITLHDTWDFCINGAHWNFFNATWGSETIVKTFNKVSDFIDEMQNLPLLSNGHKNFILKVNICNNKKVVAKPTSESGPWIIRNKD